jgi:hypothetical protein
MEKMNNMTYLHQLSVLDTYFENADVIDVKIVEGRTTLSRFIASMLSYYPWWIIQLYRIRKLLVRLLGLVNHQAPVALTDLQPQDVSFTPGENVTFFTVRCAEKARFWMSETPEDNHLKAYFGVVREPVTDSVNRFYVITTVFYKHWSGPFYFNLIRPFHHLVVWRMARHGLTH